MEILNKDDARLITITVCIVQVPFYLFFSFLFFIKYTIYVDDLQVCADQISTKSSIQ